MKFVMEKFNFVNRLNDKPKVVEKVYTVWRDPCPILGAFVVVGSVSRIEYMKARLTQDIH